MRARLRPAARLDLAEIWLATAERWDVDQADQYIRLIQNRLSRIEEFPESYPLSRSRHGIFRKAPGGEHLIFYLVTKQLIDIVRITHNRSDYEEGLE